MTALLGDRPTLRWGGGAVIALLLHASVIVVLLSGRKLEPPSIPADAILLDLPPATALTPALSELAPAPPVAEPEVVPNTMAETPPPEISPPEISTPDRPAPDPAVVAPLEFTPAPPPKPQARPPSHVSRRPTVSERTFAHAAPQPPQERPADPAPAQIAAQMAAQTAAAPSPAATSAAASGVAAATWRSLLLARLQTAKRFPERARSRGDQGVAVTVFTMDRGGRVLSAALVRSSGSALLDDEAVALIHRAAPLPPPPADVSGATITLTVPVSFALR